MNTTIPSASPRSFMGSIKNFAKAHKFISTIVGIVVVVGVYYLYQGLTATPTQTRYVTTTVATGTVIATLSETGQVSATSQVNVNSQASGAVLSLYVQPGQHVSAGQALAQIDPTDARNALTSAQESLESAELSYEKLNEAAATSTVLSDEDSVASAQQSLVDAHTSGYNDVASAFLDLPGIINDLDNALHTYQVPGRTSEENENAYADMISNYDSSATQYMQAAETAYQTADVSYNQALTDFKSTSRNADDQSIESLVQDSYGAAADISDALKAATDFLNLTNTDLSSRQLNIPAVLTSSITTLTNDTSKINTEVSSLSGDATAVVTAERGLASAQATLTALQQGADPLDLQSSQLSVDEQQQAVASAQLALDETTVRAPFSGTIGSLSVQQYQTVSNGDAIALMTSDQEVADISVSEEDAAQIQVGQKATLTFDALPNITIAGTVANISGTGTVSQGVVSYAIQIAFDTSNADVKPGMSLNASIITGVATGPAIPSTAIKTTGGSSYVLAFVPPLDTTGSGSSGVASNRTPTRVPITTGLVGSTETEVTSGLTPNQQIVVSTETGPVTTTKTAASTGGFGGGAGALGGGAAGAFGGGAAGGAVRVLR